MSITVVCRIPDRSRDHAGIFQSDGLRGRGVSFKCGRRCSTFSHSSSGVVSGKGVPEGNTWSER